ncbi:MAG: hypothetical protein H7248_06910, partial [Microbacteriaceae bacterium]|nr:hypothetical protein [Microbacteriaceae bacterium]
DCDGAQAPKVGANATGGGVTLNARVDVPGQVGSSAPRTGSKRSGARSGSLGAGGDGAVAQPIKRHGTPFRGACFPGKRVSNFTCIPDGMGTAEAVAGAAAAAAKLPPEVAARGAITVSDIAGFTPSETTHQMEPSGWTIRGVPANFIAYSGEDVRDGVLLGLPASVRFTPLAFRWDYGDGITELRTEGGDTWSTLSLPEFSATATSHEYANRGTFSVSLATAYSAEYRFAGGEWQPIDGTVTTESSPFPVTVSDTATVLVGQDCVARKAGPGC